jgi:predicted ATPase with chaperone activity
MNIASVLFAKVRSSDSIFQDIVGYENVKKLFSLSLDSKEPVSILLSGVPSSGKTMFMQYLMRLDSSYLPAFCTFLVSCACHHFPFLLF